MAHEFARDDFNSKIPELAQRVLRSCATELAQKSPFPDVSIDRAGQHRARHWFKAQGRTLEVLF